MKRFTFIFLSLAIILTLATSPANVRAQVSTPVTASAVIVPAQVSDLGFLTTALVREISFKEGDVVQAGQILASLEATDLEYTVAAAEASYRSAQSYADLQRYRTVKKYDFRGRPYLEYMPREVYLRADALAAMARASWETAQINLAQYTLLAPYDGTVVAVHALPGELVQLDQTVITIAMLDKMQIETTDLGERDISRIKVGQLATVFIEAFDAEFRATVIAISPRAETLGGDVVYKVTLAFDEVPKGLLWGMTAEVEIEAK